MERTEKEKVCEIERARERSWEVCVRKTESEREKREVSEREREINGERGGNV